MQGKIKQTEELRSYYEEHNPKGLICFEKGYHETNPLTGTKYYPKWDDNFDWFRCTVCNDITFTKKKK